MKNSGENKFIISVNLEIDAAVDRALIQINDGKIGLAERSLTSLRNKHSNYYMVHYGYGLLYAAKEKYMESIRSFDKALHIFPYFASCWFNKGISHQCLLQIGSAAKAFLNVIKYGNHEDDFVIEAKNILEKYKKMIAEDNNMTLEQYIENSDLFSIAFDYMNAREYEKAIEGFDKVIKANRNHVQAHGNIGVCYIGLKEYEKAKKYLDRAIELDPEYEPAIHNRKNLLKYLENPCKDEYMTQMINYLPDDSLDDKFKDLKEEFNDIGEKVKKAFDYLANDNEIAARRIIIKLVQEKADHYLSHFAMGVLLYETDDPLGAIDYFNTAISLYPKFALAWNGKGLAYESMEKDIDAAKAYKKVIEYGKPEDRYYQGAEEFIETFREQILIDYDITLEQLFKFSDIFRKAIQKVEDGNCEKAIELYQEALKYNDKHVPTYGNIGICYAYLRKIDEAVIWLNKALGIDSKYEPAKKNIALLKKHLESFDESLPDLLSKDPEKVSLMEKNPLIKG